MASANVAAKGDIEDILNVAFGVDPAELRTVSTTTAVTNKFEDKADEAKAQYLAEDNVAGARAVDVAALKMGVLSDQ